MIAKQSLPEPLSADAMASVDRMLDACDCIEADLVHVVTSSCVEPFARVGEVLLFNRCQVKDLKQYDIVWYLVKGQQRYALAWIEMASVTGMWFYRNANPDQQLMLWQHELADLYRCVGRRA